MSFEFLTISLQCWCPLLPTAFVVLMFSFSERTAFVSWWKQPKVYQCDIYIAPALCLILNVTHGISDKYVSTKTGSSMRFSKLKTAKKGGHFQCSIIQMTCLSSSNSRLKCIFKESDFNSYCSFKELIKLCFPEWVWFLVFSSLQSFGKFVKTAGTLIGLLLSVIGKFIPNRSLTSLFLKDH